MGLLSKIFKVSKYISFNTIFFNIRYLPFKQAIRFPIFVSRHCYLLNTGGNIRIEGIVRSGLIKLGYGEIGIFDSKKSRSIWDVKGEVLFKGKANIGHGSKISVGNKAILIIGDKFNITAESSIVCHNRIVIGYNCLFSWDILLMDTDLHKIIDENNIVVNNSKEIVIDDDVWIGCRCLILKGVHLNKGTIVAANSVITKSNTQINCVVGGTNQQILRRNVFWEI